jgi:peptidoglycan/xylan/chitin deacetylase (PgdA/CDA1 family)
LPWVLPLLEWRRSPGEPKVYLSFDDGPTPDVTERILDILGAHRAKATFFSIGRSAEMHADIVGAIDALGHSVGNHTYSHVSGWTISASEYLAEIRQCDDVLEKIKPARRRPFRPPFGALNILAGAKLVWSRPIVMWDLNSMDYIQGETPKSISARVAKYIRPGSIVLMHDNAFAGPKIVEALPEILDFIGEQGWTCESL